MTVTKKFKEDSSRAAIRALRGLEQTAIMLETYAPEIFPEVKVVNGVEQRHFGRVMMESAAEAIRQAWANAIADAENSHRAEKIAKECAVGLIGDEIICSTSFANELGNAIALEASRRLQPTDGKSEFSFTMNGPTSRLSAEITRKEAEHLHVVLGRVLVEHDDS